jgi:hypothetical protein
MEGLSSGLTIGGRGRDPQLEEERKLDAARVALWKARGGGRYRVEGVESLTDVERSVLAQQFFRDPGAQTLGDLWDIQYEGTRAVMGAAKGAKGVEVSESIARKIASSNILAPYAGKRLRDLSDVQLEDMERLLKRAGVDLKVGDPGSTRFVEGLLAASSPGGDIAKSMGTAEGAAMAGAVSSVINEAFRSETGDVVLDVSEFIGGPGSLKTLMEKVSAFDVSRLGDIPRQKRELIQSAIRSSQEALKSGEFRNEQGGLTKAGREAIRTVSTLSEAGGARMSMEEILSKSTDLLHKSTINVNALARKLDIPVGPSA